MIRKYNPPAIGVFHFNVAAFSVYLYETQPLERGLDLSP